MARVNYLTVAQNFALETACAVLSQADLSVYLVGSVLERSTWRDVDLRCIMDDSEYHALCSGSRVRARLLNAAVSDWVAARTGLPIDFQFQPMTESNEYRGLPRNAVGIMIECEAASDQRDRALSGTR